MPFASLLIPHYGKLKFIIVNASAFPPEDFTDSAPQVKPVPSYRPGDPIDDAARADLALARHLTAGRPRCSASKLRCAPGFAAVYCVHVATSRL
jgi:hypothetical protein